MIDPILGGALAASVALLAGRLSGRLTGVKKGAEAIKQAGKLSEIQHENEKLKAQLVELEKDADAFRKIAESHTIEWKWNEKSQRVWVPIPSLTDRVYEADLATNLERLGKELLDLDENQHVAVDLELWFIGEWSRALYKPTPDSGLPSWTFTKPEQWHEFGKLHHVYTGPPEEVVDEICCFLKSTEWGLWNPKRNDWRCTAAMRIVANVKCLEIRNVPPRPEIRFVEVPVAVVNEVVRKVAKEETEYEDRLKAAIEVEVASILAKNGLSALITRE